MQPGESKDHLDQTFYIDFKNGLIDSGIFSIEICDLNVNKMILVYLK